MYGLLHRIIGTPHQPHVVQRSVRTSEWPPRLLKAQRRFPCSCKKTIRARSPKSPFTNVRYVPDASTLLSVKQIWQEQAISARFDDYDHLRLTKSGDVCVPFDAESDLPVVNFISFTMLKTRVSAGTLSRIKSMTSQFAIVGSHSTKSISHIAKCLPNKRES